MKYLIYWIIVSLAAILLPSTASAYIGPGLGLSALGVIIGVVSSIALALFAIFWYPLKRFFRKCRQKFQSKKNDQP